MLGHQTTIRVIYGDTDNMGQAYYGNYFRWFEIGRSEMFRSLGLPYKAVEDNGIFLPVAESHCKYATPARIARISARRPPQSANWPTCGCASRAT